MVLSIKREIEDMLHVEDSIGLKSLLHRLLIVPVSVSTLRATGIGKTINKIAKKPTGQSFRHKVLRSRSF